MAEPVAVPTDASAPRRCGLVAVLGAPNAGKSTLVNALVGAKVSIVTPKVQTTRSRVIGIAIEGATQLVLIDTPGIFAPKRRLDRAMVAAAWQATGDADAIVLLVDAERGLDEDTRRIVDGLKDAKREAILVLNKIDAVKKPTLLTLAQRMSEAGSFGTILMISALNGDGVGDLRAELVARMPEGPWLYPEDQLTDLPMRLLAAELVREQVFIQLRQELPYATAVEVDAWEEFQDGSAKVSATVFVRRDSQRAIVLGKGGARIKEIGTAARIQLEDLLGRRIHLALHVKVLEDWPERPAFYSPFGLDFDA
ncbi:MAG TPA: GTPase Era [Alphaproteobacteria bacterium]|nr:GTPase Era [Alphaproteobacteria bacterium]